MKTLLCFALAVLSVGTLVYRYRHSQDASTAPHQEPAATSEPAPARFTPRNAATAPAAPMSGITQAELQKLIADVYHVETSRFIQPDLLWVTLPAGTDIQRTCQGIANVWSHRSGLPWVRVESWQGNQRLAQATAAR